MHSLSKQIVRQTIAIAGRHRWPIWDSRLLILTYHRVLPKHDSRFSREQPAMRVSPETLDRNLKWAGEHFKFISLCEWLERSKAGSAPKGKFCAVTFDDGWADNYQYAFPILKERQVPATIFCVTNMINGQADYWPGRLSNLVIKVADAGKIQNYIDNHAFSWLRNACQDSAISWQNPSQTDLNKMIEAAKIYSDREINKFIDDTKSVLALNYEEPRQVVNIDEILEMQRSGLIEIGSHTSNHTRLKASTEAKVLQEEVVDSKDALAAIIDSEVKIFCYPNGYHPACAETLVADTYLGGCTLDSGWNRPGDNFSALKRVPVHEDVADSKSSFKSMLSGWAFKSMLSGWI